jgi:ureidoacrylate peracid hydrolase
VPHPVTVSEHIKDRLIKIRCDVRLYRDMVPERTAFVAIDMQKAFVAPGVPIESLRLWRI